MYRFHQKTDIRIDAYYQNWDTKEFVDPDANPVIQMEEITTGTLYVTPTTMTKEATGKYYIWFEMEEVPAGLYKITVTADFAGRTVVKFEEVEIIE
jgi:hypothetical protein